MSRRDLSIRPDLFDSKYSPMLFDRWMRSPLPAPQEAQQISRSLFASAHKPDLWLREITRFNGLDIFTVMNDAYEPHYDIPDHLPPELQQAIVLLLSALQKADREFQNIKNALNPTQLELLQKYFHKPGSLPEVAGQEEDEFAWNQESRQAVELLGLVNRPAMLQAGLELTQALETAKKILLQKKDWSGVKSCSFMTDLGLVEIGGPEKDVHQSKAALIIDLAGNDLYQGQIAAGVNGCALVLDLSGNDSYLGESATQGWGFWGIGILNDLSGDDVYFALDCAQGTGLFGLGLLIDEQGSDTYNGGRFVQAASFWGLGALMDLTGEDTYQCRTFGQAYAETGGIALLCDLSGNDKYLAGSRRPDYREPDMNQSFAQGFSMGMRNLAAGGFALLADQSGNDFYQCQYFGQGASYWMGIGILYDESGKDTYTARRYSQGAGIHFSLGLLLDLEGDDHTYSWGVSQGCGHDFGIGLLVNEAGNDTYSCEWLCMGASEANGIGLFADNSGDDGYDTKTGMAVGDWVPGRRAGGIGIFLDAAGDDRYTQKGQNNSQWSPTRWAIGLDAKGGVASGLNLNKLNASSPMDIAIKNFNEAEKARLAKMLNKAETLHYPKNIEGLLSIASQGYYLETGKEAQEKLLALDPPKTVPAVLNLLHSPDIMDLIFFERFFAVNAHQVLPLLVTRCTDSDPLIRSRACSYLGQLKDTRTLPSCLEAAQDTSWRVRSSALRALGDMLAKERLKTLVPMLSAFKEADSKNIPGPIELLIKDKKMRSAVLSVLVRAVPLDYRFYRKWSDDASELKEEQYSEFSQIVFEHLVELVPLVERWIRDIRQSDPYGRILMQSLSDPDPDVKRSAAFSLAQIKYKPALPRLMALLQDPYFMVRDTAALGLVYFGRNVIPELEADMPADSSALLMLKLDILSRIGGEKARRLVTGYVDHPDQSVQRVARRALEIIAAQKPPVGVDAENAE